MQEKGSFTFDFKIKLTFLICLVMFIANSEEQQFFKGNATGSAIHNNQYSFLCGSQRFRK